MRFVQMIPALFAASTLAAKWEGFYDVSCQLYHGDYKRVTVEEQKQIIIDNWEKTATIPEASRAFSPPGSCPSNSDDTYKWVDVPQWDDPTSPYGRNGGGSMAVVYFKETDTYRNCGYLASAQQNGYAGRCG